MDAAEFEQFVREHAGVVRSLAFHILHTPNDVEDITQEVFIRAFQSLDSFRGGSFRAYVTRIARNYCYDVLRKTKARRAIQATEPLNENLLTAGGSPEDAVLAVEFATEMDSLLRRMNAIDREILLMKHVHGMSYEEIAEVVDMRIGTVRTRISRARNRMVTHLQRRENGEPSFLE